MCSMYYDSHPPLGETRKTTHPRFLFLPIIRQAKTIPSIILTYNIHTTENILLERRPLRHVFDVGYRITSDAGWYWWVDGEEHIPCHAMRRDDGEMIIFSPRLAKLTGMPTSRPPPPPWETPQ